MLIIKKLKFFRRFIRIVTATFGKVHVKDNNGNISNRKSGHDLNNNSSLSLRSKADIQDNQDLHKHAPNKNGNHSSKHRGLSVRKARQKLMRHKIRKMMKRNKIRKSGKSDCSGDGQNLLIMKSKLLQSALTSQSPSNLSENIPTVSRDIGKVVQKRSSYKSVKNPDIKALRKTSKLATVYRDKKYSRGQTKHPMANFYNRNKKKKISNNLMKSSKNMTGAKRIGHRKLRSIRRNSFPQDITKSHDLMRNHRFHEDRRNKDSDHAEKSKLKKKIPKYELTIKTKDKRGRLDAEYQIVIKPNRAVNENTNYQFCIRSSDKTGNKNSEYRIVINGDGQLGSKLIKNKDDMSERSISTTQDNDDKIKRNTCGQKIENDAKQPSRPHTSTCEFCYNEIDGEYHNCQNEYYCDQTPYAAVYNEQYYEQGEYDYEY